jgi:hypothetical protein
MIALTDQLALLGAYVVEKARGEGCCCEPEVLLTERLPGVYSATVGHDDYCPRLRVEVERRRVR